MFALSTLETICTIDVCCLNPKGQFTEAISTLSTLKTIYTIDVRVFTLSSNLHKRCMHYKFEEQFTLFVHCQPQKEFALFVFKAMVCR